MPFDKIIWRNAFRQIARVPDLQPVRVDLDGDSTPEVGVVTMGKGIDQTFANRLGRVETLFFPCQPGWTEAAAAGSIALDESKGLFQHLHQWSFNVLVVAVGIVALVAGVADSPYPHLRMAHGRVGGKQHIAAIGKAAILQQSKTLQSIQRTIGLQSSPLSSGSLTNSGSNLLSIKIPLRTSFGEAPLPTFRCHLTTHDHILDGFHIGPDGLATIPNENFIPETVGKVLPSGNFYNADRHAFKHLLFKRDKRSGGQTRNNSLFQLLDILTGGYPDNVTLVGNADDQIAAAGIKKGADYFAYSGRIYTCFVLQALILAQGKQTLQRFALHDLPPRFRSILAKTPSGSARFSLINSSTS